MIELTFWMNMPSFYQDDFFRELAQHPAIDLQVVYSKPLDAERVALGWQTQDFDYPAQVLRRPGAIQAAARLAWKQRHRVHVVNGIWAEAPFAAALTVLRLARARYALHAETPSPRRRHPAKQLFKRLYGPWAIRGAAGFFAVSAAMTGCYMRRYGLRERQIYPFGYFLNHDGPAPTRHSASADRIDVLYVGQLVQPRKGLDLLLHAIAPLLDDYPALHLTLIGGGPDEDTLRQQAEPFGSQVVLAGVIPSGEIRARMAQADLVVLPSRHDGWGVVVNEALSVGVPVVVSDRCGAAELVTDGVNGYVFRGHDAADLRARLDAFVSDPQQWPALRAAAAQRAATVSVQAVVPYFVDCLEHMLGQRSGQPGDRPAPPWLQPLEVD